MAPQNTLSGKFAALYPFCGILIEVIILVIIIFIFERRQARKARERDLQEQSEWVLQRNTRTFFAIQTFSLSKRLRRRRSFIKRYPGVQYN